MAISVEVELSNLSEEGVFAAAKAALQGADFGKLDWNITGPIIERLGISITYSPPSGENDARLIFGINEYWDATRLGELLPETGRTPHHAVAKAVVAQAMVDKRLPISIENAIAWVEDRWTFVEAIQKNSEHHHVTDLGSNRFSVRALSGHENLEHFQNIVRLSDAVIGEYLEELEREFDPITNNPNAIIFQEL